MKLLHLRAKILGPKGPDRIFEFEDAALTAYHLGIFKEDEIVEVIIRRPSKEKTNEQFRYLFSCVYSPMSEDLGYEVDEVDGIMKKRFLTVHLDTPMEYVLNKTDLNREELGKYIDDVRRFAAGLGIQTLDATKFFGD